MILSLKRKKPATHLPFPAGKAAQPLDVKKGLPPEAAPNGELAAAVWPGQQEEECTWDTQELLPTRAHFATLPTCQLGTPSYTFLPFLFALPP